MDTTEKQIADRLREWVGDDVSVEDTYKLIWAMSMDRGLHTLVNREVADMRCDFEETMA